MLYDGTLATSTTRATLVASPTAKQKACAWIIMRARHDNGARIWVGGDTVATGRGAYLAAGDSLTLPYLGVAAQSLGDVYAVAESGTPNLDFIYFVM